MGLFRRKRKEESPAAAAVPAPVEFAGRSFGFKSAWLAVRARDPAEVADALGVQDVATTPWAEGIAAVYEDAGERPAPVFAGELDLAALSRRFGEVQRFATHRVVESHGSAGSAASPTAATGTSASPAKFASTSARPTEHVEDVLPGTDADPDDWAFPDEERVMEIAGAWSVDPTTIDDRDDVPDDGLPGPPLGRP